MKRKVIKIDKNYALAYYEKGLSLDNMGKYKEAIDCYDKVVFERKQERF